MQIIIVSPRGVKSNTKSRSKAHQRVRQESSASRSSIPYKSTVRLEILEKTNPTKEDTENKYVNAVPHFVTFPPGPSMRRPVPHETTETKHLGIGQSSMTVNKNDNLFATCSVTHEGVPDMSRRMPTKIRKQHSWRDNRPWTRSESSNVFEARSCSCWDKCIETWRVQNNTIGGHKKRREKWKTREVDIQHTVDWPTCLHTYGGLADLLAHTMV